MTGQKGLPEQRTSMRFSPQQGESGQAPMLEAAGMHAGSVPESHVAAAQAVGQGPPNAHEACLGGVPSMRVAGIKHLLPVEVLPAALRVTLSRC